MLARREVMILYFDIGESNRGGQWGEKGETAENVNSVIKWFNSLTSSATCSLTPAAKPVKIHSIPIYE